MPNYTPASRYLLAGIAILMLFAALPAVGDVLRAVARHHALRSYDRSAVERIRVVDAMPLRRLPQMLRAPLAPPPPPPADRW